MIIVKDDLIPLELQDYYHTLVFGNNSVNAMLPLVCKYEPTATDNGVMPVSFEHVLKSSTKLTEHFGNLLEMYFESVQTFIQICLKFVPN